MNSLTLKDMVRCQLTKFEQLMLAHQKKRFVAMESGSVTESSQEELFQKVDIERLISTCVCYQPQTDVSRNLLLGVLYKNGRLPKTIDPIQSETNTKTGRRIYVTSKYSHNF